MFNCCGKVAPKKHDHFRTSPFLGNPAIVAHDGRFDLKLPHREKASVARSKLTDYLLSETHPVGRWKRKFFTTVGLNETNVDSLARGLISLANSEELKESIPSPYGTKYIIDGKLEGPSGGIIRVRTVWIIEKGQDTPRFVTAYPL